MIGVRSRNTGANSERGPNLLDMTPVREVEWEEDDAGIITLVRQRPAIRGPRSMSRWVSYMMAPPRIRLDDVGSYAWLRIDGRTDVRSLVAQVREEYGDRAEPVSQRLGQFIRLLHRERFVRYR